MSPKKPAIVYDVLIDMDGVLVDFVGGVCRLLGVDREQIERNWPRGCYDLQMAFGGKHTDAVIWKSIYKQDYHFWMNLEIERDATNILKVVKEYIASGHSWIVSTPTPHHAGNTMLGKQRWVDQNIGSDFDRIFFCKHKELLARPDRLLIDDCAANCDKFVRAGGQALLWPRVWNSNYARVAERWEMLEEALTIGRKMHAAA